MSKNLSAVPTGDIEELARTLGVAADGLWRRAQQEGPRSPNHLVSLTVQLLATRFDVAETASEPAAALTGRMVAVGDPVALLEAARSQARALVAGGELSGDFIDELDAVIREVRGCAPA